VPPFHPPGLPPNPPPLLPYEQPVPLSSDWRGRAIGVGVPLGLLGLFAAATFVLKTGRGGKRGDALLAASRKLPAITAAASRKVPDAITGFVSRKSFYKVHKHPMPHLVEGSAATDDSGRPNFVTAAL